GCHRRWIERLQRLVDDDGAPEYRRCGAADDKKPAGRDDADAERQVARIDEMDAHSLPPPEDWFAEPAREQDLLRMMSGNCGESTAGRAQAGRKTAGVGRGHRGRGAPAVGCG